MLKFKTIDRPRKQQLIIASYVGVWLAATLIFIIRNRAAFELPNFYAEDGTVLFGHIYTTDPVHTITTLFNGYLIVGQYLLAYAAAGLNFIIGNNLVTLPTVTALVSCAFLGLTASLPYLLFRKELGTILAGIVVLFTALVPMYSYDYAIIGSISNLKFVFLYIAFMLVLYRFKKLTTKQYIAVDIGLFICTLTNATVALLVPLVLMPYIFTWFKTKKMPKLHAPLISAVSVSALGLLYVAVAVLKGIPKIPGYLDQPFGVQSLLPYIERNTLFAWTYPITSVFNSYFVALLLVVVAAILACIFWQKPKERLFIITLLWAMFVGAVLLVVNRPGIGQYFLTYVHKGGPDQFFYAQSMIVVFATGWLVRDRFKQLKPKSLAWVGIGVIVYLSLALQYGTSFGGSAAVYKSMMPIRPNLEKACKQYGNQNQVIIQIYPTPYWQWYAPKDIACDGVDR